MIATCEIAEQDWTEVRALARQVGLNDERMDLLRVQATQAEAGTRVLLTSAGEGTLELLLSRWLGEEAGEALRHAGPKPLVLGGPSDSAEKPAQPASWAVFPTERLRPERGQVVALGATGRLPARVVGELAAAGRWDSVVLVTRASMPVPQAERELIASLSKMVAVVRVLVVVVPGELPAPGDADKVARYARAKVEANGFSHGRCEGVWFWWLDGQERHDHAVAAPDELLVSDRYAVARGREFMLRAGMIEMLRDIERQAVASARRPLVSLSDDDLWDIDENCGKALLGVQRQAEARFRTDSNGTDAKLRSFVLDTIVGWGRGNDFTAVWLNYVENVRPGARAGLFEQARSAVDVLALDPASKPRAASSERDLAATARRHGQAALAGLVTDQVLRVGLAVLGGVVLWGAASVLALPGIVGAAGAAAGSLAAFAIGLPVAGAFRRAMQRASGGSKPAGGRASELMHEGTIRNFNVFENTLRTWLNQHVRATHADVVERCRALAQRFHPES